MNSLIIMVGSTLIGGTLLDAQNQQLESATQQQEAVYVDHHSSQKKESLYNPFLIPQQDIENEVATKNPLSLEDIAFIEMEGEVELDFDTKPYLPAGFNPYKSGFDADQIAFEDLDEIGQNFGIASSLPANFDPYAIGNVMTAVNYIELEDEVELGFDTALYLPENFDPYGEYDFLSTIEFIEMDEEDFQLGFDTVAYLPSDFDPHNKE